MIWRKIRKLVVIVVFLLLVGGIYVLVVEKMIARIKDKKNQIQEMEATQEYQRKRIGDIPGMRDDFEMAEKSEEKMVPFLNKDNAVDVIQEIEKLSEGANSRVAIEVMAAEAPVKGKSTAKDSSGSIMGTLPFKDYIQFRIKTAGSLLGLVKFINRLESSKYYLDIVSIQINTNPDAGKEKKKDSPASANPFISKEGAKSSEEEKTAQNEEEIISSIGVVVYTQNQ